MKMPLFMDNPSEIPHSSMKMPHFMDNLINSVPLSTKSPIFMDNPSEIPHSSMKMPHFMDNPINSVPLSTKSPISWTTLPKSPIRCRLFRESDVYSGTQDVSVARWAPSNPFVQTHGTQESWVKNLCAVLVSEPSSHRSLRSLLPIVISVALKASFQRPKWQCPAHYVGKA